MNKNKYNICTLSFCLSLGYKRIQDLSDSGKPVVFWTFWLFVAGGLFQSLVKLNLQLSSITLSPPLFILKKQSPIIR